VIHDIFQGRRVRQVCPVAVSLEKNAFSLELIFQAFAEIESDIEEPCVCTLVTQWKQ
jgi:hypothetical protein